MLNLPAPMYCDKGCGGCYNDDLEVDPEKAMTPEQTREVMDFFKREHGTEFITINGRGDIFHPEVRGQTLEKINYAASKGIQSYVFTAGDSLDNEIIETLSGTGTNVMISLLGNDFIDTGFFDRSVHLQPTAYKIKALLSAYTSSFSPVHGTTRIGMNYVISKRDVKDETHVSSLKHVINDHGIFFVCNTNFQGATQEEKELAHRYSDFNLRHSTAVDGICQMGAGSSATVDYDGALFRCPYMKEGSDGNFFTMTPGDVRAILTKYRFDIARSCVVREQ